MKKLFVSFFILALSVFYFGAFKDVPVNHWAYDAVNELSKLGIVSGMPDGTFQGNQGMTRYQVAVALYRMMNYIQSQIDKAVSNTSNVSKLREQILTLSDIVSTAMNKIEDLSSLKDSVQIVSSDVSELKTSLVNTKNDVKSLSIDISSLKNKVDELNNKITILESKMLNEDINKYLSQKVDLDKFNKLSYEFDNFKKQTENKLDALNGDIVTIKTENSNMQKTIDTLNNNYSSLEEYLNAKTKALDTRISTISGDVTQLKVDFQTFKSDYDITVQTFNKKIEKLNQIVSNYETTSTVVENLNKNYSTLKSTTESKIDELSQEINEIKNSSNSTSSTSTIALIISILSGAVAGIALYLTITN
ncbi:MULTISPECIES: S-layer homology domain-containing protein [unclassified Thermosipho (in: thermotogales)]|uniref:S-layer homology domain-containing protein n=1 Tax=unclassified Thermosipho (in: thermotogales) TaxID=2676525 RepID=UPI0009861F96|nr:MULTISPECIES: S-layer homology domain-containing protein [unclassified Thermosipho (in: thermotogales)]MBT1248776.1 S-layer protein [Thermosipho sp. 1244]OOC47697.1 S-layer protein [Thermosipho sp. 1223]